MYFKNIPAEFLPDLIRNDGALYYYTEGFLEEVAPSPQQEQKEQHPQDE